MQNRNPILFLVLALLTTSACQQSTQKSDTPNAVGDLSDCIRIVRQFDEGRWNYMGTIARLNGKFRTYETTSVHAAVDTDIWSIKSFGGDVGGDEANADIGHVKLVGNSVIPFNLQTGELMENAAVKYTSCSGPDKEGRYETTSEYKLPNDDGTFDIAKNMTWYSEHGSYFAEDHFNDEGRVVARRSGVYTPAIE